MIKLDIFDTDDSIFESGLRDDAYGVIELGLGVEGAVNPDIDDSELIDDDPDDTGDLEGEDVVAGVDDDPDPEEYEDDDYDDAVDDALPISSIHMFEYFPLILYIMKNHYNGYFKQVA